jgi:hypothetical protein
MQEAQHTPGPWDRGFAGHGGEYIGTDDEVIAQVAQGPRCKANAKLIEAAPELLEALEAVNETFRALSKDLPYEPISGGLIEQVRAAIAKATTK